MRQKKSSSDRWKEPWPSQEILPTVICWRNKSAEYEQSRRLLMYISDNLTQVKIDVEKSAGPDSMNKEALPAGVKVRAAIHVLAIR